MSLVKNSATIGVFTLASRVLGFVRDVLGAHYLGAGFAMDAFSVAWRLPNLFRALFAEGAFSASFVPMFNRVVGMAEKEGREGLPAGIRFAEDVLSILLPFLVVFTTVIMAFPKPVVWLIALGFKSTKLAFATELTQITFPYLALISLVSLLGGIMNSLNRFWVNAAAPIMLNVCMIGALLLFATDSPTQTAHNQAIAITVSGVAQLAWLIFAARQVGVRLKLKRPTLDPQVKKLLAMIWPAAIGQGAIQFNVFVITLIASVLPQGSVSYIYYADRLNQLPLALVGIGVGTAILPAISRQIIAGDERAAMHTQNRAIELALLLALPAAAGLMLASLPLITATLRSGQFTAADARASAAVLTAFACGLPAYILIKVFTPGFYARADTKTPVRIALIEMACNMTLNLFFLFFTKLSYVGLAISGASCAWINAALLYFVLHRRGHLTLDAQLRRRVVRLAFATIAMGALLLLLEPHVMPHIAGGFFKRIAWLLALIVPAAATYFGAAFAFGAFRINELKAVLLRRRLT